MNAGRFSPEAVRLDDAARAGWLYYVAGNTQDEIARKLGVSRQSAQRLVAMAVSDGADIGVMRLPERPPALFPAFSKLLLFKGNGPS